VLTLQSQPASPVIESESDSGSEASPEDEDEDEDGDGEEASDDGDWKQTKPKGTWHSNSDGDVSRRFYHVFVKTDLFQVTADEESDAEPTKKKRRRGAPRIGPEVRSILPLSIHTYILVTGLHR
jgi:hypothetical protein